MLGLSEAIPSLPGPPLHYARHCPRLSLDEAEQLLGLLNSPEIRISPK
jgi:hypothetical protein